MSKNQKTIVVDPETHARLKKICEEGGVSIGQAIKSFINMVENRVAHAKKHGVVLTEHPKVHNPALKTYGRPKETYSDYLVYIALHFRDIGLISEEDFEKNREDLPFFVFAMDSEVVEKVDQDRL